MPGWTFPHDWHGESEIDKTNVTKHRADVFRLAVTLPGDPGPILSQEIRDDLRRFLDAFPKDSGQSQAILAAIRNTVGGGIRPETLIGAIQTYFHLGG